MDEYEGMLKVATQLGIVENSGAWYTFEETKWQGADKWRTLDVDVKEAIFQQIVAADIKTIDATEGQDEVDVELSSGKKEKKSSTADAVAKLAKRKADANNEEAEEAGE